MGFVVFGKRTKKWDIKSVKDPTITLSEGQTFLAQYTVVVSQTSIVESDWSAWGATVDIDVPCGGGCTLTPGYWKTHSSYGPAPYDSTWAALPQSADTTFFLCGQSYYDVLWTSPKGDVAATTLENYNNGYVGPGHCSE